MVDVLLRHTSYQVWCSSFCSLACRRLDWVLLIQSFAYSDKSHKIVFWSNGTPKTETTQNEARFGCCYSFIFFYVWVCTYSPTILILCYIYFWLSLLVNSNWYCLIRFMKPTKGVLLLFVLLHTGLFNFTSNYFSR